MRMENKKLQIRNSTAEFLIFIAETGEKSIEVMYAEENVWATQEMMATLYDTTKQNVSFHLINAYEDKEIDELATVKEFLTVQNEGVREVQRKRKFYSLEAIISVGFKVNSTRAFAESEFEKYRITQDKLFKSDFDRLIDEI